MQNRIALSLANWTPNDVNELTKDMQVLTKENFETTLNKRVHWLYVPYAHNHLCIYENTFIALVDRKEKKEILAKEGETFIYLHKDSLDFFDEPTFTCSDVDREVYFKIIED